MCRSRRELSNAYFLAKFGFDTAENEPSKVCRIPRCHQRRRARDVVPENTRRERPRYLNVASKEYDDRTRIGYMYFGHQSSGGYGQWPMTDLQHGAPSMCRKALLNRVVAIFFAKIRSFSAVSAPIFASKYAFCSVFQHLPEYLAEFFEI